MLLALAGTKSTATEVAPTGVGGALILCSHGLRSGCDGLPDKCAGCDTPTFYHAGMISHLSVDQ